MEGVPSRTNSRPSLPVGDRGIASKRRGRKEPGRPRVQSARYAPVADWRNSACRSPHAGPLSEVLRGGLFGCSVPGRARLYGPAPPEDKPMWKKPKIVETYVGLEINSYACADLA